MKKTLMALVAVATLAVSAVAAPAPAHAQRGVGVGIAADVPNIRQEFTAAGVPFEKRVGRLLEGLRLARSMSPGTRLQFRPDAKVRTSRPVAAMRSPEN